MDESLQIPGWGRSNGFLEVGVVAAELSPERTADRLLVLDVINRYGFSYDERDLVSLGRTFTDDAVFDGSVAGSMEVGPYRGREDIVAWLKGHMDGQEDQRRHAITNPTFVSQTSTAAVVNAYLVLTSVSAGQARLVTSGFYKFELEKLEGGWAISHIFAGFDSPF
jgi:SnoaL-like domain